MMVSKRSVSLTLTSSRHPSFDGGCVLRLGRRVASKPSLIRGYHLTSWIRQPAGPLPRSRSQPFRLCPCTPDGRLHPPLTLPHSLPAAGSQLSLCLQRVGQTLSGRRPTVETCRNESGQPPLDGGTRPLWLRPWVP